ncbi:MAG: phospholipase D-like domain-containing protein, partial [Elusimicrobia bacterium]|nr:phospholipase D-like domain-containing protein [Elusimicrobiota bacterium]
MQWQHVLRRYLHRRPPGSGDFTQNLDKFLPGNRLRLLETGDDAFQAMLDAIASARSSVHLETYILRADATGEAFAERLIAKARQGISVRLIYDSFGCLDLDAAFLTRLRNAGVRLLEYHPVAPWRPRWGWTRRDHRKLLVVDSRLAFTGGVNICHEHAGRARGGRDWNDAHLRIEGPAAYELDRLFRGVWFRELKRSFPLGPMPDVAQDNSLVWVAANQEFLHRHRIRRAYLNALRTARREVLIANAYFLPDRAIRKALAAAARRGAAVRLLVPGRSDIPSVWNAGRATFADLLKAGVRLFEWDDSILHAKMAAIDGVWCAVGSYNMDHRTLRMNLEVNIHALDCELAGRM